VPRQIPGTIQFYKRRGVIARSHREFFFTPARIHPATRSGVPWFTVKIEKGKRVRAMVKLQVVGGDVIEQSVVEYFQGAGTMLAGLEAAVEGKEAGAKLEGKLKPEEAFGNPETVIKKTALRTEFPADAKLEKGAEFAAKGPNGQAVVLVVEAVTDKTVDVVLMHTLAKKEISYEVEVLSVTDPTPPPIPGGLLKEVDEETGEIEKVSDKN
jgi:FKBP-type peptidyl-prolyl cis-trans isomerase SlyD